MNNKLFYFVLLVTALFASSHAFKIQPKIVNGEEISKRGQFPYHVHLSIEVNSTVRACGGTLICNEWIVTSANCVNKADIIIAQLGVWNLDNVMDRQIVDVIKNENVHIHPGYIDTLQLWNDIALVKLGNAVQLNEFVQPIEFPSTCESNENRDVIAIGHGSTKHNNRLSNVLRYAPMTTISQDECIILIFPFLANTNRKSVLCAISSKGSSTCYNDTGSPIVTSDGKVFIGFSNFIPQLGCDSGLPQAFTSIVPYMQWISLVSGLELTKC